MSAFNAGQLVGVVIMLLIVVGVIREVSKRGGRGFGAESDSNPNVQEPPSLPSPPPPPPPPSRPPSGAKDGTPPPPHHYGGSGGRRL